MPFLDNRITNHQIFEWIYLLKTNSYMKYKLYGKYFHFISIFRLYELVQIYSTNYDHTKRM